MTRLAALRNSALVWFSLTLAVAIGGSLAARVAASRVSVHAGLDVHHHYDKLVGLSLPIPIVNGADGGWAVVAVIWVTAALLAFCGWRLGTAIAASARRPEFALVSAQLAIGLLLTFFSITVAADLYAYVIYGRLYGIYGINPYLLSHPVFVAADPSLDASLRYFGNPPPSDNYGPLWTLLAGLLARMEMHASLWTQAWTHRLVAVVAAVAATLGLLRLSKANSAAERTRRCALFAFHPLVMFETAVGAHNDMIMVALAVWAFAIVDELPLLAGLVIGASVAVKYVSLMALPFLTIIAGRRRPINGVMCAVVALAVTALFFKPFWLGAATLYSLIGHGGVFGMSPGWMISYPFFAAGAEFQPAFASVPSLPLFGQPSWPRLVQLGLLCAFLIVLGVSIWRFAARGRAQDVWRTVVAFLWASPIIHPWYLLWLAPAAAWRRRWSTYAWWFAALLFLRYALDVVAPQQVPVALLFGFTLVFLTAPIVIALNRRVGPGSAEG